MSTIVLWVVVIAFAVFVYGVGSRIAWNLVGLERMESYGSGWILVPFVWPLAAVVLAVYWLLRRLFQKAVVPVADRISPSRKSVDSSK